MKKKIPRPEYPRPQFVRSSWKNLNGHWDFKMGYNLAGLPQKPESFFNQTILVPFCPESILSGLNVTKVPSCVWYRKFFSLNEIPEQHRVFLHFGAIDYKSTIWVNQKLAGTHQGGYTPFSLDITNLVKKGKNEIIVKAIDQTPSLVQPSGKQTPKNYSFGCYYTRITGIWQTVWLEIVPSIYIRQFKIFPHAQEGTITIQLLIEGEVEKLKLKTYILNKNRIINRDIRTALPVNIYTIKLKEKRLWQPGSPFLYDLTFELFKNNQLIDRVNSYFGLRSIHWKDRKVLINDQVIFQRMVLDQGYYPQGLYTAPTDKDFPRDIKLALKLGFNGARLHQKIFEPRFLYWADRLGYLVWAEYPNWGTDLSRPEAVLAILKEWPAVIDRDFNHPCIIGWCPLNEITPPQATSCVAQIYDLTKQLDPTRPVIDASGWTHTKTDIYDCHNYEQDPAKFATYFADLKTQNKAWSNFPEYSYPYQGQPFWVSEYGGIWWQSSATLQKQKKSWGYGKRPPTRKAFIERYQKLTTVLLNNPGIFGFCYTQLYDTEQETNGLYTYQRKPKFNPNLIRKINIQKAAIEKTGQDD